MNCCPLSCSGGILSDVGKTAPNAVLFLPLCCLDKRCLGFGCVLTVLPFLGVSLRKVLSYELRPPKAPFVVGRKAPTI